MRRSSALTARSSLIAQRLSQRMPLAGRRAGVASGAHDEPVGGRSDDHAGRSRAWGRGGPCWPGRRPPRAPWSAPRARPGPVARRATRLWGGEGVTSRRCPYAQSYSASRPGNLLQSEDRPPTDWPPCRRTENQRTASICHATRPAGGESQRAAVVGSGAASGVSPRRRRCPASDAPQSDSTSKRGEPPPGGGLEVERSSWAR